MQSAQFKASREFRVFFSSRFWWAMGNSILGWLGWVQLRTAYYWSHLDRMAIVVLKLPIWMARQIWRRKQLLWPRRSSMLLGFSDRMNSTWFQHISTFWVWWFGSSYSSYSSYPSIIHLSLVSIRLHRCLCFRMRLGTVGGLGLDARPVFCVKRPTETCTPLKAHCVTWKNWKDRNIKISWRSFESEIMWNSYFMIFVHMS